MSKQCYRSFCILLYLLYALIIQNLRIYLGKKDPVSLPQKTVMLNEIVSVHSNVVADLFSKHLNSVYSVSSYDYAPSNNSHKTSNVPSKYFFDVFKVENQLASLKGNKLISSDGFSAEFLYSIRFLLCLLLFIWVLIYVSILRYLKINSVTLVLLTKLTIRLW